MTPPTDDFLVYIVEDDAAVRDSLSALLAAHGFQTELCETAGEFLEKLETDKPSCVLLDLRLPGMNGMELQAYLNERKFVCPIIVVTAHGDVPLAVKAMREGAFDFIEKPPEADRLIDSVRLAQSSFFEDNTPMLPRRTVAARLAKLTEREHEVLGHLLRGRLNKEIAEDLSISRRTVEVHRARIHEKMQARGIADLIRMTRAR